MDSKPTRELPDAGRHKSLPLLLWVLVILVVTMGAKWVRPFEVGFDDGYILQSAANLAAGRAFGHTWHDNFGDLANPTLSYVGVDWAPGYPLAIATLVWCGFPVIAAVHLLELVAAVAGIFGWLRLARRLLSPPWESFFAVWILVVFFADRSAATNLVLWSFVPWIVRLLLDSRAPRGRRACGWLGLLVAAALEVRYSALFLLPGCLTYLMLSRGLSVRERLLRSASLAWLPSCALAVTFWLNHTLGGQAAFTEDYPKGFFPAALFVHSTPLRAVFGYALGLEGVAGRVTSHLPAVVRLALGVAIALAMTGSAIRAYRAAQAAPSEDERDVITAIVCLFGWLLLMLAALTLRHGALSGVSTYDNWTFLGHGRYLSDLMPAVGLGWVMVFQRCWPRPSPRLARVLVIGAFVLSSTYTLLETAGGNRIAAKLRGRVYDEDVDDVRPQVLELLRTRGKRAAVVLDDDLQGYARWQGDFSVAILPTTKQLQASGSSAPVRVIAVVPSQTSSAQSQRVAELANAYSLRFVQERVRRRVRMRVLVSDLEPFTATSLVNHAAHGPTVGAR